VLKPKSGEERDCPKKVKTQGYLTKLGFWFRIKARVKTLPQAYRRYSEDKIFACNAELGQKDNFSR